MATTTVDRERDGDRKKRKQGGFRTMPFILVNEVCDRFATAGFSANLITYLTHELHLPLVEASNALTNFSGTSSLTPILGALAADSFAGRFWTIIAGSVFYQLGMLGLVVSALVPSLRPAPCSSPPAANPCRRASGLQLAVLYLSLLCTSLGSGGIRPCVVAFGADQFDHQQQEQQQQQQQQNGEAGDGAEAVAVAVAGRKRQYFNLYFFTMGFAVLLALTVVVYIQENVGVGVGLRDPGHRHVRLHPRLCPRLPALRPAQARRQPLHAPGAGRRRRVQEADRPAAGGPPHAVPGQGARRAHLHQRQAPAHQPAHVLRPGRDRDGGGHRGLRQAGPVAALDGAPRGGAQVPRPHAAHLVRRHPARHRGIAQQQLRHHAGAHHGPPRHAGFPDPAGDHVHLQHRRDARHPRPLRPRIRASGAPLHGTALRDHLLPANGRRPRHLHPRRRLRGARGGQAPRLRRRARPPGHPRDHSADERVLAGAAVRHPRRGGGVLVGRAHGVPLRPGAREHAQHRRRAILALRLPRQLHGYRARHGGAERHAGQRRLAPGQHQQGQAGRILLARHLPHDAQPGILPHMLPLLHHEAVGDGGRR